MIVITTHVRCRRWCWTCDCRLECDLRPSGIKHAAALHTCVTARTRAAAAALGFAPELVVVKMSVSYAILVRKKTCGSDRRRHAYTHISRSASATKAGTDASRVGNGLRRHIGHHWWGRTCKDDHGSRWVSLYSRVCRIILIIIIIIIPRLLSSVNLKTFSLLCCTENALDLDTLFWTRNGGNFERWGRRWWWWWWG